MLTLRVHPSLLALATLSVATFQPAISRAHFVLESPAAMTEQNVLGDPQKAPPCGDNGSAVQTGERTSYTEGSTVSITIRETIYHPGHYRVALAVNDPSELPAPPPVTEGDTPCGSAPIDPNPSFPVLADGVLQHTSAFDGARTFEVTLPSGVTCDNCTLQVIEFMSDHELNNPGGCYYHHCANIQITPSGEPGGDAGAGGDMDAGTLPSGDGDTDPEPDPSDEEPSDEEPSDEEPSDEGSAGDESAGGDGDGAVGSTDASSDGCAIGQTNATADATLCLGVVAALALRTRRRRAG